MSINILPISDLPLNSDSNSNSKFIFLSKDHNGREINTYVLHDVIFGGENLYYPNILSYSKYDKKRSFLSFLNRCALVKNFVEVLSN